MPARDSITTSVSSHSQGHHVENYIGRKSPELIGVLINVCAITVDVPDFDRVTSLRFAPMKDGY